MADGTRLWVPCDTELLAAYVAMRDSVDVVGSPLPIEAEILAVHEGFVVGLASRMAGRGGDHSLLDDLAQEGRLGLLTALRRYVPREDATFLTFAAHHVRGRMSTWVVEQVPPFRINANTQRAGRRDAETLKGDRRVPRWD